MYEMSTHRIWSSVVFRPVLIAGMATFTIVVSNRIMKNPVVKTKSTSQGLVRACAMSPPQAFNVIDLSGSPLQPSVGDLLRDLYDPVTLGFQHCDLVFHLDQGEALQAMPLQFAQNPRQLGDGGCERHRPRLQVASRFSGVEVMHEHQPSGKVRVLAPRLGQDFADDPDQHLTA